jgi:hypothetical protein
MKLSQNCTDLILKLQHADVPDVELNCSVHFVLVTERLNLMSFAISK